MSIRSTLIRLFEQEMRTRGVIRKDIARRLGISSARVSQILKGDQDLKVSTFERMFEALGVTIQMRSQDDKPPFPWNPDMGMSEHVRSYMDRGPCWCGHWHPQADFVRWGSFDEYINIRKDEMPRRHHGRG